MLILGLKERMKIQLLDYSKSNKCPSGIFYTKSKSTATNFLKVMQIFQSLSGYLYQ